MELSARRLELPPLASTVGHRVWRTATGVRCENSINFTTISDLGTFEELRLEWISLFAECGDPHQVFQTFEWLAAWAPLYIDARTRLSIVTGRVDGRLVLVWPLVVQKSFGLHVLSCMGDPVSQYSDALMAPGLGDAAADAAFAYIMALPVDVVALRRVRDDAAIAPVLRRWLGASVNRQASPFVDFTGASDADAFEKRFSGKLRTGRRRRKRRLEERGTVTCTHHGPSAEAATLVATSIDFKRQWASQTGILAPALRDPRFERFFVAAALACDNAPQLQVSALRCNAEILGVAISVACKGRLFGHVLAPRPGLGALGLGGILAELIIRNALDQGYEAVDLLAPADSYKLEWTTTSVGVGDYCVSLSAFGALYTLVWLRFGRAALKAIVGRLKPAVASLSRLRRVPVVDPPPLG